MKNFSHISWLMSFVLSVAVLFPVQSLAADKFEFDQRDLKDGRPPAFYELAFDSKPEICGPALIALNEPNETSRDYDSTRDHGRIDASFFLGNRYGVKWEKRIFIFKERLPSGQIAERQRENLDTVNIDIFGTGLAEVLRFGGYLHSVWRYDLYAPAAKSASMPDESVDGLRVYRSETPTDFSASQLRFANIDVASPASSSTRNFTTIREALEHAAYDYSYFELIRISEQSFVLMLPARTSWFGRERYAKGVSVYLLRPLDYRRHILMCEFKSRYVEVLRKQR